MTSSFYLHRGQRGPGVNYVVYTGVPFGASLSATDYFGLFNRWNNAAAFSFMTDAGGRQRYFLAGRLLYWPCLDRR